MSARECELCGVLFEPKQGHAKRGESPPPQRFCSSSHRHKHRHAEQKYGHLPNRCPHTFKINYQSLADALAFRGMANSKIHNAYECRCGSWHWGRLLTEEQKAAWEAMKNNERSGVSA